VILIVKGKADRALCCACRHLYEPKPSELIALHKPGRKPICPSCYSRISERIDHGQPVYREFIS
jgi:NAD-dependent SIR2 family protein deacetylase